MDAIPTDVSGDDECAFYQFAWHEMLQLVQQKDGLPLFATWPNDAALFPATGPPEPWQTRSDWPMTLRQTRKVTPFLADHIDQAATHSPLVDQKKPARFLKIHVRRWLLPARPRLRRGASAFS